MGYIVANDQKEAIELSCAVQEAITSVSMNPGISPTKQKELDIQLRQLRDSIIVKGGDN